MTLLTFLAESSAAAAAAHGAVESGIAGTFGIDVKAIVMQIVWFGIFAGLLWHFGIRPIGATLDDRQKKIADGLQYAEEMKLKLADAERRHAETLKAAQSEATRVIDEARATAKALVDKAAAESAARTEDLLRKGRESLELERAKTLAEVRAEVARLVVETTGRVLAKDLSETERRAFNEAASRELSPR